MPTLQRKPLLFSLVLLLLVLALLAAVILWRTPRADRPAPAAQQSPTQGGVWIDLNVQPSLVEWFNHAALPGDMARADQFSQISSLDEVTVGRSVVVFRSAALAEEIVPRIADKIHVIGYNLEHGPLNPPAEQADPVGSVQRMRALADRYGMKLALGPDHDFALSHGAALAPYVDIFVMQVQRVQTDPERVRAFVVPLAQEVRQANRQIQTSMQVRTEGDVDALVALIDSLAGSLDGVSILTSPDTAETARALVAALRPATPALQAPAALAAPGEQLEAAPPETNPSWFLLMALGVIGVGVGALGGIVLTVFAVMVWLNVQTHEHTT